MTDYHTVIGGVLSAEGKIKINAGTRQPETVVSWRHYLCDASFLVALQTDPVLIDHLASAVQSPQWPIYLGRRSCPPSRPVFDGVGEFSTLIEALASRPVESSIENKSARLRTVVECEPAKGIRRRDEIDSRSRRTFGPRYTRDLILEVAVVNPQQEASPCTSPA